MFEVAILLSGFLIGSATSWAMLQSNEIELRRKLKQANEDFWRVDDLLSSARERNKRYAKMVESYQEAWNENWKRQ